MKDVEHYIGLYGRSYKRGKTSHLVIGAIQPTEEPDLYHIDLHYMIADWGNPPARIKNPDELWDFFQGIEGDLEIETVGCFTYPNDKFESLIELPYPVKAKKGDPFTHIESVTYSKRDKEEVEYTLAVSSVENGTQIWVTRDTKGRFTESFITQNLKESRRISMLGVKERRSNG